MGMSTHVSGFKPADAKWKAMKDAWDACVKAGTNPPDAVLNFFDYENPSDKPVDPAADDESTRMAV